MSAAATKTIALIGALDTKGAEYAYLKECIEARGFRTLTLDIGVLGEPFYRPEISRDAVAEFGGSSIEELVAKNDRGAAMKVMSAGALPALENWLTTLRTTVDGLIALGGGGGTSVACSVMRDFKLGLPKVMVSTLAGGDVSQYVGLSDIVMIPSIVDIAGLNRISRGVIAHAAGAICGMVETNVDASADKPLIVASMFGNTTPAVERARKLVEADGYEVLVFHATGTGGRTMESLITSGQIDGVLDITTTEWADELCGGVLSAGPLRLRAAAEHGVPAVIAPGCLDMANFRKPESVPEKYKDRKFYPHNPDVTLMRTNVEENRRLGELLAEQINESIAPVTVVLPLKGVSMLDAPGGAFWWPEADAALFESLKKNLREDIEVVELDCNVNDPEFAERCVVELKKNMDWK
jgi:uncharacterized protein (UPF0261 family)